MALNSRSINVPLRLLVIPLLASSFSDLCLAALAAKKRPIEIKLRWTAVGIDRFCQSSLPRHSIAFLPVSGYLVRSVKASLFILWIIVFSIPFGPNRAFGDSVDWSTLSFVPGIAPAIVAQSGNQTVDEGQGVSFFVIASGSDPLSYQWRYSGGNLSGRTGTNLDFHPVALNQAGIYDVVVSNSSGSVTSAPITLKVLAPLIPPRIVVQPVSQTVNAGENASFSVVASGTPPLSYQWQFRGTNLTGETGANLTIPSVTTNNAGNYDVIVSGSSVNVRSARVSLTVVVPVVPPTIVVPPVSQTVNAGANASFSVVASGTAPLSYQWQFSGTNLPGETGTNLTIPSVTTNSAGNYDVIVSNSSGSVTSAPVTLTVLVPVIPPTIVVQPVSEIVTTGQDAAFAVWASGTGPLSYQWQFGGTNLLGETGTNLTIHAVTTNNAGNYEVIVSNSSGSVTSAPVTLTVLVPVIPPTIVVQPVSEIITTGQDATFAVSASGTGPLGYQWQFSGTNLPGETGTNLTLHSVTTNNAGNYEVIVSNSSGSVTSAPITLTVLVLVSLPTIVVQPVSQTVTTGQDATFAVWAIGTGPLSYQWQFGGTNLLGETGTNLAIHSVTTNNAGNYDVIVSNSSGSVTSAVLSLTVVVPVVPPTIVVQPVSQTVTNGQDATFAVSAGGTAPLSYQWQFRGTNLSGETGANLTIHSVTTNSAGNYDVIVSNSSGSVTSAVVTLAITLPGIRPVIRIESVSPDGKELVLSLSADAVGFTLESVVNLAPPLIWVDLPNAFAVGDRQLTITNVRSGEGRFFRLRKP